MRAMSALLVLCFTVVVFPVNAHEVKTNGSMSVLLHTDPDDDPVAGATNILHFTFTDRDQNFLMENCDCSVYIAPYGEMPHVKERGAAIDLNSTAALHSYGMSYGVEYIFPFRDVYAVVLEGAPRDNGSFEPFRFEYTLRVAKGENIGTPSLLLTRNTTLFSFVALTTLLIFSLITIGILMRRHTFKK